MKVVIICESPHEAYRLPAVLAFILYDDSRAYQCFNTIQDLRSLLLTIYLQENLKPPTGKEDVKIESLWEGKQYYLPGRIAGPERYRAIMKLGSVR